MSAFICSDKHISAIVSWAYTNGVQAYTGPFSALMSGQEAADMLLAENIKSVNYRYPVGDQSEVVTCDYHGAAGWRPPVQVVKLCQSLAYQSCEHPGWQESETKAYLESVKSAAIRKLPGYEAAPWSI